jgi:hypothetical protein
MDSITAVLLQECSDLVDKEEICISRDGGKIEKILFQCLKFLQYSLDIYGTCISKRHLFYSRAYIEFERPQNSYFPILPAIYLALKMRYSDLLLLIYH